MGTGRQLHVGSMVTSSNSELRGRRKRNKQTLNQSKLRARLEKYRESAQRAHLKTKEKKQPSQVLISEESLEQCVERASGERGVLQEQHLLLDGIENSPHVLVHLQALQECAFTEGQKHSLGTIKMESSTKADSVFREFN